MFDYSPLLMIDFYKATHHEQYPKGLTKMVSYYTPRMTRLPDTEWVAQIGAQLFVRQLQEAFDKNFFSRPLMEVVDEYRHVLDCTMGPGSYEVQKIIDLHQLGYIPLEISAIPEGTRTKIGVPQIQITNTHPNFVWLVNTIETLMSCSMWHTQVSAEVGYRYRQIVNKYWEKTCDSDVQPKRLLGDFSMRGQQSAESAIKSSIGWLCSFVNTATVPAIMTASKYYDSPIGETEVGYGAISTEHSVMCSNFAVDGDEITHVKRLLTEIYPNHNFSMVSDSYDYWNLVTNILPQCRKEIMEHNGCLSVRGDSGDPIEIIAGKEIWHLADVDASILLHGSSDEKSEWLDEWYGYELEDDTEFYFEWEDQLYEVKVICNWTSERGGITDRKHYYVEDYSVLVQPIDKTPEIMGTVWTLWQYFGGTVNSKGYKVLDPHVKAIYGDSITPQRCQAIYDRLAKQGFSIQNVALGVGSFSFMCLETTDRDGSAKYNPYTRDTFGIAVKATYAEDANGNPIMIHKQPKGASWKKSQRGCCVVNAGCDQYIDGLTWKEVQDYQLNMIQPIFRDGEMINPSTLAQVRERLHNGDF